MSIYSATIAASAPEFGLAVVYKTPGAPALKDFILARLPYNDRSFGALPHTAYLTGETVICMSKEGEPHIAYILCSANECQHPKDIPNSGKRVYNIDAFTGTDNNGPAELINKLIEKLSAFWANYNHNADRDIMPGDFDAIDQTGIIGFHVGRMVAAMHGSPLAFIDVSSLTNTIRMLAQDISSSTPMTEYEVHEEYTAANRAITLSEAFGVKEGTKPFKLDGDVVKPENEQAIPLFRIQHIEGAAAGGVEDNIVAFPKDEDAHTPTTEPPVLSKVRRGLTGELTTASTASIESIKSPFIEAIQQVGYKQTPKTPAKLADGTELKDIDDMREPFEKKFDEDQEDKQTPERQVDDAAMNKLLDTLLSGPYLKKLKEKMAENGLILSTKEASVAKQLLGEDITDKKLIGDNAGPTTKAAYDLPKVITITDPVSGKQQLYYASTSFITQEKDGSILIGDGYGSEIRMSRGNIYICPALDMYMQPGRDATVMAPRHATVNSQKSLNLNTSGDAFFRAVKNMRMAGATGGAGSLSIECDATGSLNGVQSGLIINSKTAASITASTDVYIGRNKNEGNAKGTVTEPTTSGNIIIDAGSNGCITEHSYSHTVDSVDLTMGSLGQGKKAAITVGGNFIGLYAEQVLAPCAIVAKNMNKPKVKVFRKGKIEEESLSVASDPSMTITGNVLVGGSMQVYGNARCFEQFTAKTMGTTTLSQGMKEEQFKHEELKPYDQDITVNVSNTNFLNNAAQTVYQDSFLYTNKFAFPTTYGIPSTIKIPGTLWQGRAIISGKFSANNVWSEPYVKNSNDEDTACYPGKDVWEDAKITRPGYKEADLKTGYIINTTKEK